MEKSSISVRDIYLDYPSTIYNRKTLKQTVFELAKLQKPKTVLHDVHALKGVSFEMVEGNRVGVIGHNGAGKSTLLKALAGIYPITGGEIEIKGQLQSLFDLAVGFEIDATGRENIAYRGLLLGESPKSIKEKTQEIIEFAELGEFIDYPVKSYSSGMIVRLAFAISTMIKGDILLLDEVFGAGDAKFMQKAKKRIMGLIETAKILVFVSHDFNAVRELCNRAIWLDHGEVKMDGDVETVINEYLKAMEV
ncbi:ABC transporter ATP-binding protein [Lachnospiraceae bacterium NSJ-143]|nr:ABC transporter ATP-binding protein [Lachnospiraceae bacterium NSJ-143]